jgi:branched-chain amino acid transport system ATP-binding protein
MRPARGWSIFRSHNITGAGPYKIQRLGMGRSFQITTTFDRLTAFQNIRLAVLSKRGIRFNFFRNVDKMDRCHA